MFQLAWQFIRYDKAKSVGALMGVVMATFLIGQQSGIYTFLTNGMATLVTQTETDLWVVDNRTTNVNALSLMDVRRVREVASIPGVAKASPLLVTGVTLRFPNGISGAGQMVGVEAPAFVGGPPTELVHYGKLTDLQQPDVIAYDYYDMPALGDAQPGSEAEIAGKRVKLGVQTKGVRGFSGLFLYAPIERARYLSNTGTDKISAVLVRLQPGADALQVRDAINRQVTGVRAWVPAEFAQASVKTVLSTNGVGTAVTTLIVFATIAGTAIIGLTLYSAAIDRIKDYGTLKAIGAGNGFVSKLILTQAVMFGIIGYGIGALLIYGFRKGVEQSGALFSFSLAIWALFLSATVGMSILGSVMAIRRIKAIEPAAVFRT